MSNLDSKPTAELLECLDILMMEYLAGDDLIPAPDPAELETALWQTADLTMALLFEHMQALDDIRELEKQLKEKERLWTPK